MPHKCSKCNRVNDTPWYMMDNDHDVMGSEKVPACQHCGSEEVVWVPAKPQGSRPQSELTYDRIYAVYRNAKGEVKDPSNGNTNAEYFTCGKCSGPALMIGCNCYYESYRCENCGERFNVN